MSCNKEFSEEDLIKFEDLITIWSCEFVEIFSRFSPSELKLPKLHSWRYHVVPAIRQFGSINSFTTETFETLHKYYVKIPYRKSNKKEVRQKALIESTTKTVKQKIGQLSSKLYDIRFSAFENHLETFQQLEILNPLQLEGMENLLDSLNKLKDDILLDKVDSFI
ncbi:hypothetical protein RhiirA4_484973 [Rhizophagus irregularis]|uniref:Uncharacterized protein n=1 Tax=Rhizophagus irregularis TaxID=588596 RepID=A0A2I1HPN0_9GLOM|nr:hypothetical protein RhiirA4_484973 [Rhizophagus irregularis]